MTPEVLFEIEHPAVVIARELNGRFADFLVLLRQLVLFLEHEDRLVSFEQQLAPERLARQTAADDDDVMVRAIQGKFRLHH